MLIDWFTVAAQAVNFLVLVWLLKRFLYRPILEALDKRERRIASELAEADRMQAEAKKESLEFERKNQELDRRREELLTEARESAHAEGRRLLEEARRSAEEWGAQRREGLLKEAKSLQGAIGLRARDEVLAISRRALADLAGADLEERLAEAFVKRIGSLEEEEQEPLAKALGAGSGELLVRSALELPDKSRQAVQKALQKSLGRDVPLRFETAPNLIGGIELIGGGQKVAWSLGAYLDSLQEELDRLVEAGSKPPDKPEPGPEMPGAEKPGPAQAPARKPRAKGPGEEKAGSEEPGPAKPGPKKDRTGGEPG